MSEQDHYDLIKIIAEQQELIDAQRKENAELEASIDTTEKEYDALSDRCIFLEAKVAELEAENGELKCLLKKWLNQPYGISLRTRTKTALREKVGSRANEDV